MDNNVDAKIYKFRNDRIIALRSNEMPQFDDKTPLFFEEGPIIVFHLIPVSSFAANQLCKTADVNLPLLQSQKVGQCYNDNGKLFYSTREDKNFLSYTQLYYDGVVEAASNGFFTSVKTIANGTEAGLEKKLCALLGASLKAYKDLDIVPPFVAFLTLAEADGYKVCHGEESHSSSGVFPSPINNHGDPLYYEFVVDRVDASPRELTRLLLEQLYADCDR